MFYGQYSATIDTKGRLSIPRTLRESLSKDEVIVSQGFEQVIFGYDRSQWEEKAFQYFEKPLTDEEGRAIRRNVFANAFVVKLDDQGRILLPQRLLHFANLDEKKEAVSVVGAGDHFEIWRTQNWEDYVRSQE